MADLLRRPGSAFFWWCLPLLIGFGTSLLSGARSTYVAAVWSVSLAWMGTGCILNALRCRRLHCYIAGPALVLGAIGEALLASGVVTIVAHAQNNIAGAALVLALLSFVPEMFWGRYLGQRSG
jgi:hypothetical protein